MSRNRFLTSSNPLVSEERYLQSAQETDTAEGSMTIRGAVNKTFILAAILLATAAFAWHYSFNNQTTTLMYVGLIGGLVSVFVTYMNPKIAGIMAPIYAAFQGLLLGTLSVFVAAKFGGDSKNPALGGIVLNAIMLTMLCLGAMLAAYKTGLIKPTEKFKSVVVTATMSIMFVYLGSMLLGMFGVGVPYLHEGGVIGIIVSLVIVVIASLNLIIDFEQFEVGEANKAPKYMEWLSAMGLLVTLIWLYIEILKLLMKLKSE
jgi:uncharacterized YccA/Bax inhibitor family protein